MHGGTASVTPNSVSPPLSPDRLCHVVRGRRDVFLLKYSYRYDSFTRVDSTSMMTGGFFVNVQSSQDKFFLLPQRPLLLKDHDVRKVKIFQDFHDRSIHLIHNDST